LIPLGALLLLLTATGLSAWIISRIVTTPLNELKQLSDEIASGNLQVSVEKSALGHKHEIGELARSFDVMASSLRSMIVGRQHLLRDLSHELRSPIARMQMAFALAGQDEQNIDHLSKRLQQETDR